MVFDPVPIDCNQGDNSVSSREVIMSWQWSLSGSEVHEGTMR